jgi:hypothetical protein
MTGTGIQYRYAGNVALFRVVQEIRRPRHFSEWFSCKVYTNEGEIIGERERVWP